jgi:RNA polymerase sigma factor (sigma-70 family)
VIADEDFASFYRREYLRTVLYLLHAGASEADAKDAAQEAMTQAYRRWDKIEVSYRAWVRRAAFSCYVRQREKAHREIPSAEPLSQRDKENNPADDHCKEEQFRVTALLRQLPEQQRLVIALFYDGWSYEEIAEALGKQVDTVRSNLRHARSRLKEIIQSEGTETGGDRW